ncbi:hypothetical protein PICMEDRAFT_15533 [Pichia membranifaciens NRRL Y-2026]|uniref:Protein farnesyltransferase subunit beta n=1 Tax=Pichia membranifaciens NRRL Y-2026 TaxID=763406 RepID=A0A1E3NNC4_9ASCO|nr:hypothetical protein PICMEDRAFT_15533 [Pichia membranifaciens NRRL Y-2026]ODQ47601.1 hypothetical protein PICMEDRAFT_15533 [Pichia membranifaciens NRRL Y-2026]
MEPEENFLDTNNVGEVTIPDFDKLIQMIRPSYDSFSNSNAPLGEKLSTTIERKMETEVDIQEIYENVLDAGSDSFPGLTRKHHTMYSHGFLSRPLQGGFAKLDASRPWICFWLTNSVLLLNSKLTDTEKLGVSRVLLSFFNYNAETKSGGFGGGSRFQLPHLADSYAAVMALALTEDRQAWSSIDRVAIRNWLGQAKQPNGSFQMHKGGESDTRAVYCALCIAQLLAILDEELVSGVKEWLLQCQTYEGGFAGEPGDEAHGGYTFCALAALFILMSPEEILHCGLDIDALFKWTVDRQFSLEGGFSGRTNKLVDGCYSHWIGGTMSLLEVLAACRMGTENFTPIVDRQRLQNYILCCCQDNFGLRDKPGCVADFYHTNYVLCGLSMCQHSQIYDPTLVSAKGNALALRPTRIETSTIVDNLDSNSVAPLDAVFGLPYNFAQNMFDFFRSV